MMTCQTTSFPQLMRILGCACWDFGTIRRSDSSTEMLLGGSVLSVYRVSAIPGVRPRPRYPGSKYERSEICPLALLFHCTLSLSQDVQIR
jgi:hypothetical protein